MGDSAETAEGRGLMSRLGITIAEATRGRVVGSMPVEGNTQGHGRLHGGASALLAETLGSMGSAICAGPQRIALGIEINVSHHRAATVGFVTGVATPLHLGTTLATWEVVIRDEEGKRVCTARVTCALRARGQEPETN